MSSAQPMTSAQPVTSAQPTRTATGADPFTEHSREVDGRPVRYVTGGAGEALLVVHGGMGWRGNLSPAVADLTTDHRVVAPELPGFGTSPGDGITSMRQLAGVVTGLMRELDLPRFSVLGSSVGAIVALWAAIDHPDAVATVVLEAPGAFRAGAPRPSGPPPGAAGPPPEQLAFMMRVLGPETDPDLVAAMPGCLVPTLAMFGADDPLFPPTFAPEYRRLPAANLAIVHAAGHDIKGARPAAFLATVRDYLDRGPAFVVSRTSTLIHA